MSLHCARTSRRTGLTALALLALAPAVAHSQATDGTITTLAQVGDPADLAYAGDTLLVADRASNFVRAVAPDGTVTTVAGTGNPAADCQDGTEDITRPRGITPDAPGGGFLVTSGNCVMRISPTGDVVRFAGTADGQPGVRGDGGNARSARLRNVGDVTVAPDGSVYITDTGNDRIRRVAPNGTIATVVGTTAGFGGDGGPATQAQIDNPRDIAIASDGSLLIADLDNARVRRVAPDGTITTVAGGGGDGKGFSGDGEPATRAQLNDPVSLVALTNNGFLVADGSNSRIRRVTPLGTIFTVVGGGTGGDGGLAKDAQLNVPEAIAARPGGGFAIADTGAGRVRLVTDVGAVPDAVRGRTVNVTPALGTVTVRPVGGATFLPLAEEDLVLLGSKVDARTGELDIAVQRESGVLEPARIFEGFFKPVTVAGDATNLKMIERLGCGSRSTFLAKKKRKRRLWVDSKGKYRIKGRYVGALERGTQWRVTETCDRGTVTVFEGRVLVMNRLTGQRRLLRAGESLTVRAR